MGVVCPECGCVLSEVSSCQEIFESFLALEFSSPGYGEVHMLTVACYMIQHGRYSDEALVWIAENLRAHLQYGLSTAQIREQVSQTNRKTHREWKILRPTEAPRQAKIAWSMNIGGIAGGFQDASSYCVLVRKWAFSVLAEMQPLLSHD